MKEGTSYYVILGIISLSDCSGYDIRKKIDHEIGYFYKVSNGQVYPVLRKLVQQKNATFTIEKNDGKPDRKVYAITDQGAAVLKGWLESRHESENELLLKLYFGSNETIGHNIKLLLDYKSAKEACLAAYNKISEYFNLSTIDKQSDYYSYFTLRFGQLIAKAHIDWSDEVINTLRELDRV